MGLWVFRGRKMGMLWKCGKLHGKVGAVLTETLGIGRSPRWTEIKERGYYRKRKHPGHTFWILSRIGRRLTGKDGLGSIR